MTLTYLPFDSSFSLPCASLEFPPPSQRAVEGPRNGTVGVVGGGGGGGGGEGARPEQGAAAAKLMGEERSGKGLVLHNCFLVH